MPFTLHELNLSQNKIFIDCRVYS